MKKIISIVLALCLFAMPVFSGLKQLDKIEKYKSVKLGYALGSLCLSIWGFEARNTYGFMGGLVFGYFFINNTLKSVYSYSEIPINEKLNLIYEDNALKVYEKVDENSIFYQMYKDEKLENKNMMFKPKLNE